MMLSSKEMKVGPLLVNALLSNNRIATPTFSFAMMGFTSDVSYSIDFGAPVPSKVQGGAININTTVTLGYNDDFFWSASL